MKRSIALLVLLGASLARAAPAPPPQPEAAVPKGPPPQLSTARMDKSGALVLTQLVPVTSVERVPVEVQIDGKTVTQIVQRQVTRYQSMERTIKPAGLQGYDLNGKKLSAEALAGRLRKRTVVAISTDGKPVDPVYLTALKPGTVALVIRHDAPPGVLKTPPPLPRERKKE